MICIQFLASIRFIYLFLFGGFHAKWLIFLHIICQNLNNRSIEKTIHWNNTYAYVCVSVSRSLFRGCTCMILFFTLAMPTPCRLWIVCICYSCFFFLRAFKRHQYYINHHHNISVLVVYVCEQNCSAKTNEYAHCMSCDVDLMVSK